MISIQDIPTLPNFAENIPDKAEELSMLKNLPLDEFLNKVISGMVTFAINLAIAIVVFCIGKFIIGKIYRLLTTIFVSRKVDRSLTTFLLSLIRMLLYLILIVIVIGIVGIETSSFIALFASAGVALGMALSGTLQNFAGGVLILLIKPYKVGDFIEAAGYIGRVKEIQIFNTVIVTVDNKSIIIPNGSLSNNSVNNYSREKFRRVDWEVAISYGDSVDDARKAILAMLDADDRVIKNESDTQCISPDCAADTPCPPGDKECEEKKPGFFSRLFHRHSKNQRIVDQADDAPVSILTPPDMKPVVFVKELGESCVTLTVRAWTANEHYWPVFFKYNEDFYNELPKHGINFPFPQLDIHIKDKKS